MSDKDKIMVALEPNQGHALAILEEEKKINPNVYFVQKNRL